MALNVQTFRTRALSAVIFAAVMLTGLLWNQWSFLLLFTIIHFGCWWEYFGLLEKIFKVSFHSYSKLGFMLLGYGLFLLFCGPVFNINGYSLRNNLSLPVSAAGFVMLVLGIFQRNNLSVGSFVAAAGGFIYISLSWGLLLSLYEKTDLHIYDTIFVFAKGSVPLLIIASIWVNDTMAYIVGSFIGKTPLSPISPKKTWEGTVGGIVLSVIVVGVVFYFIGRQDRVIGIFAAVIALVASITGTFGDLFESKLKRLAGVKDSGSLMPGHGGYLDRFDSLLVATPFIWILLVRFVELS